MKQIFLHQNLGSWPPEKERPKHQNTSSYFFSRLKLQLHSSVVSLTFLTVIAVLHVSCPKSVLTACAPAVCDLEHSNGSEYLIFCVRLMLKCDFIDNLARWFFRQKANSHPYISYTKFEESLLIDVLRMDTCYLEKLLGMQVIKIKDYGTLFSALSHS